jgi:hypothetical protein
VSQDFKIDGIIHVANFGVLLGNSAFQVQAKKKIKEVGNTYFTENKKIYHFSGQISDAQEEIEFRNHDQHARTLFGLAAFNFRLD